MKTRILAIAVASLFVTVACKGKHSKKKDGGQPAATVAQQDALKQAMSEFWPNFDSKDQTVSGKIKGIDADIKNSDNANSNGAITVVKKLSFQILFKDSSQWVDLTSKGMTPGEMNSSTIEFDYSHNSPELQKAIGGSALDARAKCLDAECGRLLLSLEVWPAKVEGLKNQKPNVAGIIFVKKDGEYNVETSNSGVIPSIKEVAEMF